MTGENEEPSLIMLVYNHQYSEAILKYGADSRSNIIPSAVEEVLHDQKGLSNFFIKNYHQHSLIFKPNDHNEIIFCRLQMNRCIIS